ncbi:uncharacterized protein G2W53_011559 [Senna tora]|uniref:Uncharacterized protein n=1 Tax=Senna tora TaxID=362788 RepID=A0A835CDD8_9FABA|nr:uncharacterized protein G2W53_011559 [Senna tora]
MGWGNEEMDGPKSTINDLKLGPLALPK